MRNRLEHIEHRTRQRSGLQPACTVRCVFKCAQDLRVARSRRAAADATRPTTECARRLDQLSRTRRQHIVYGVRRRLDLSPPVEPRRVSVAASALTGAFAIRPRATQAPWCGYEPLRYPPCRAIARAAPPRGVRRLHPTWLAGIDEGLDLGCAASSAAPSTH